MDLDTRHLRALVAVVDEGTFTDAAIALGTSQASVSRSVQRLEAILGRRLLARSSRSMELTAVGERVVLQARRLLLTLAQLEASTAVDGVELQVGYAWAALGGSTVAVQRAWAREQPGSLVFIQTNTPTAGLLEGRCQVAVVRREVTDPRLDHVRIGQERRYAVLAADHPLADRSVVRLVDLAGETVALDLGSGTTTQELWAADARPVAFRMTDGIDEWLTLIAAGAAVGVSSEATRAQHPRAGIAFRPLEDAPEIPVWLAWWRDDPPPGLAALIDRTRAALAPGGH